MDQKLVRKILLSTLALALVQSNISYAIQQSQLYFYRQPAAEAAAPTQVAAAPILPATNGFKAAPVFERYKTPVLRSDADGIVQNAMARRVSMYFGDVLAPVTVDKLADFESDFDALVRANTKLGFLDDEDAYRSWWNDKKTGFLLDRSKIGLNPSIQEFFMYSLLLYKHEVLKAETDSTSWLNWFSVLVKNPYLHEGIAASMMVVNSVWMFASNLGISALKLGPPVALVNATTDPAVGPTVAKINQIMGRLGSPVRNFLTTLYFGTKKPSASAAANLDRPGAEINKSLTSTINLMNDMGFDLTASQAQSAMAAMEADWTSVNTLITNEKPDAFKNGRNALSDLLGFRPQIFARSVITPIHATETHRQGIEQAITSLRATVAPESLVRIETLTSRLMVLAKQQAKLTNRGDLDRAALAEELIGEARAEILSLTTTGQTYALRQIDAITSNARTILVLNKSAATALAFHVFHDYEFSEYNREKLNENIQEMQRLMTKGYGLDYFHEVFRSEVVAILNQLKIQVAALDAAKKAEILARARAIEEKNTQGAQKAPGRISSAVTSLLQTLRIKAKPIALAAPPASGEATAPAANETAPAEQSAAPEVKETPVQRRARIRANLTVINGGAGQDAARTSELARPEQTDRVEEQVREAARAGRR